MIAHPSKGNGTAAVGRWLGVGHAAYPGLMLLRESKPGDYHQMADILYGMGHDQEGWDYQYASEGGPEPSLPSWVAVEGDEVLGLVEGRFDSTL